jgi:predicted dehydrogenase
MMGKDNPLVSLAAHTAQLQPHLPPVDTIEAVAKAKNGAVGTITISFGTTQKGKVWAVGCEKGYVSVSGSTVTAGDQTWDIKDEGSGVAAEVRSWGKSLVSGTWDPLQCPEEALADFELIEASLRSGEQDGQAIKLKHQDF